MIIEGTAIERNGRKYEWFQLTRTVTNPHADKRTRHDWRAAREWTKGMRILVTTYPATAFDAVMVLHSVTLAGRTQSMGGSLTLVKPMIEDGTFTPTSPTCWEFMAAFSADAWGVLDTLLGMGTITQDDIRKAVLTIEDHNHAGRDPIEKETK